MNKETLQVLKTFANSGVWDIIRGEVFEPLLDNVKDVSIPFKVGEKEIEPQEAYMAKALTAQKLKEIVEVFDRLKKSNVKATEINFE